MEKDLFGIPLTIVESREWKEIEIREGEVGPEALLEEIIDKRNWTNVEMLWVIKRMIFFYGRKDALLKKAPTDRLMANMNDVLRALFIMLDRLNPDIDDNLRIYISTKLADATWGVTRFTRDYLHKVDERQK